MKDVLPVQKQSDMLSFPLHGACIFSRRAFTTVHFWETLFARYVTVPFFSYDFIE